MITIVDTLLFKQPIVAVVNNAYDPPRILSLRKGSFSDGSGHHETSVADYHAEKSGQAHIEYVKLYADDEAEKLVNH